jgi:hypothetical protein
MLDNEINVLKNIFSTLSCIETSPIILLRKHYSCGRKGTGSISHEKVLVHGLKLALGDQGSDEREIANNLNLYKLLLSGGTLGIIINCWLFITKRSQVGL